MLSYSAIPYYYHWAQCALQTFANIQSNTVYMHNKDLITDKITPDTINMKN